MRTSVLRRTIQLAGSLPLLAIASSLAAQTGAPPQYLQIFREEVKVGRGGAHPTTEAGWPRAYAKAKIPNHYIAMTTVYGPAEAWFLEGRGSIAEIDNENKAIEAAPGLTRELSRLAQADAANISSARAILGRYRPELSNPSDIDVAQMRVWEVLIFNVRPGREANFVEAARLYQSVVQQAKAETPWATYEVMAGMPGPTFLVFAPHKTLAEIDPATGPGAAIEKAMTEETMKKFGALAEGYVSIENMVFSVSPEMSYPSPELAARDSQFWNRKPPSPAKAQPSPSKSQP
jgi:hypothetical protein